MSTIRKFTTIATATAMTLGLCVTPAGAITNAPRVDMRHDPYASSLVTLLNYNKQDSSHSTGIGLCTGSWIDAGDGAPQWAIVARHCLSNQGHVITSPYDNDTRNYIMTSTDGFLDTEDVDKSNDDTNLDTENIDENIPDANDGVAVNDTTDSDTIDTMLREAGVDTSTIDTENAQITDDGGIVVPTDGALDIGTIITAVAMLTGVSVLIWYLVEGMNETDGNTSPGLQLPDLTTPHIPTKDDNNTGHTDFSGNEHHVKSPVTKAPIHGLVIKDNNGRRHNVVDVRYPHNTLADIALVQVDRPVSTATGRQISSHPVSTGDRFVQYGAADQVMRKATGRVNYMDRYYRDIASGSPLSDNTGYVTAMSFLDNGSITQGGDSGGPIYSTATGKLMAVNSAIVYYPNSNRQPEILSIPVSNHYDWIMSIVHHA